VLTRSGRLDEMEVLVESRPQVHESAARAAGETLAHAIKHSIGIAARVTLTGPGAVERSLGKARRVVDRRPIDEKP